jgi:orotidine-5'-phosphate decarboxylase
VEGVSVRERIVAFNRSIVDATKDIVGFYKPNAAFYEAHGAEGWSALKDTMEYVRSFAPEVPVIFDAKRADIGSTNNGYVNSAFDQLGADAITVHPYQGGEALAPFLEREDKGIIVWCRSSNDGAGEFQDLRVDGKPLYMIVAEHVAHQWNKNGNCALVVGATYPSEIAEVRKIAPTLPLLIPGTGEQGGNLEKSVKAAQDSFILSTSRAIIYADDVRGSAQQFDSAIRQAL